MFKDHDKTGLGIINVITFTYILVEHIKIKEKMVLDFVKVFDPSNKGLLNYMEFIRLIHDPSILEEMPLFQLSKQRPSDHYDNNDQYSQNPTMQNRDTL